MAGSPATQINAIPSVFYPLPIGGGSGGIADSTVEIWVAGAPVSTTNPLPIGAMGGSAVTPGSGSSGFTPGSVLIADSGGAVNEDTGLTFNGATNVLTVTGSVTSPRFISTVATGTAPFTVASTTVVTNLNADLLDGLSSADFAQLSGLTVGSVLFVGTGPVLVQDNANLFWDDTNNRLGVGTASPSSTVDVLSAASASGLQVQGVAATSTASGNGADAAISLNVVGTVGQATSDAAVNKHGGVGAAISVVGGVGGATTGATSGGAGRGGNGGDVLFAAGKGGNATSATGTVKGGTGGNAALNSGIGGTSLTSTGGNGGDINVIAAVGGVTSAAATSGAGGGVTISAGVGGACSTSGGTAGSGGDLILSAGGPGAASGGASAGAQGTIQVGRTLAGSIIRIGLSTSTIGFFGATAAAQIAGSTDVLAGMVTLGFRAASSNPPLNLGTGAITAGTTTVGLLGVNSGSDATKLVTTGTASHPSAGVSIGGYAYAATTPSTATTLTYGFEGLVTTAAASFTMVLGAVFAANAPSIGASSTITTLVGHRSANLGASGVTNAIGVDVLAQSGAATLNIAGRFSGGTQANVWLNSDTASAAGGITLGVNRDTDIYRGAAGVAVLTKLGVTNSATATVGVGTIAKKIEVFDGSGASLGFIPVYATIT